MSSDVRRLLPTGANGSVTSEHRRRRFRTVRTASSTSDLASVRALPVPVQRRAGASTKGTIVKRTIGLGGVVALGLTVLLSVPAQAAGAGVIHVPSDNTAFIQQVHIAAGHIICAIVEEELVRGGPAG